jgi:hypothetical protein
MIRIIIAVVAVPTIVALTAFVGVALRAGLYWTPGQNPSSG